ncbi:uncharacterized protein LTR77_009543 [Saxophila tyrrhenica]|uniref:Uncharacterized protein n=1 Tax=Saxophila tyrrhenica TaxID=1690608 RepID=A0AAV9P1D7_9PEZI|nr:hypothetical protein LTR77_009543 [Saxophila tyrrhenica]
MFRPPHAILTLLLCLIPSSLANSMATTTTNPYATHTLLKRQSSLFYVSSSSTPTANDSAPGGSSNNTNTDNSGGLVNYYFGFLALILCAVGLCIFLILRRRYRMRALYLGRQQAGPQGNFGGERPDGGWTNWNPERRHEWGGRWGHADASREEGLNEYGEAPPAYVPKTSLEEREDYSATQTEGSAGQGQSAAAGGSSPHPPERAAGS